MMTKVLQMMTHLHIIAQNRNIIHADSLEICFLATGNIMFLTWKHKFLSWKHKFLSWKHKFLGWKHKIPGNILLNFSI